ncbi:IS110 family transposase [Enterococcus mundtii]|uniref:IS110 family transposase n=1 Tax=Enterococcus TaxID=1350 RepID=UPI000D3AC5AB|nr:IS110 family transposase [Enterococcus mundtii]PTO43180.1 IS110 family transposase [Enterococcus mundtii]
MSFILAFDVSKGESYKVLYHDRHCLSEGKVLHNQEGFRQLLEEIIALPEMPEIVFEATGVYSRPLEKFCQDHLLTYCLLNPLEAKKQMEEGTLRSWKTDKIDAHRLAQTHWKNTRLPKIHQAEVFQELRDLARFYQEIEDKISRVRMDLHQALQLTFPELEHFFSSRVTPYALSLIEAFPHPEFVLASTRTKIKNRLVKSTRKCISENRAWQKADQILTYAQNSYPAVDAASIHCQKTSYYARLLQDLLEQKESLMAQMIQSAQALEEFELYQSIPGIGAPTVALLIGELGDIRRFPTANQLNAFVGIDIRRFQSGNYVGKDHINKRGNPKGRKVLYFSIRNMIRQQHAAPNHLVDYYYKLKKQPVPKKEKVATVACMNKLLKCMHSMVRNHTMYAYAYTASNDQ